MDFPQYRKLSNNKTYYKIRNERAFDELQVSGNRIFRYEIKAGQYPEMLRISEMLNLSLEHILPCGEEEYVRVYNQYLNAKEN